MKLKVGVIMIDNLTFSYSIDNFLNGNLKRDQVLVIGDVPEIYLSISVPNLKLIMTQNVLTKITLKHNLKIDLIRKLPALLKNPIIILRSATEKSSVVAVLDALDCNGCFVIAAIHPDRKYKQHKVNLVASVYGKSRQSWFAEQIEEGRLLYLDKEKALHLSQSAWLQLPREVIATEHVLIIPSNQPEVKNNNQSKPILTIKKGNNHENK